MAQSNGMTPMVMMAVLGAKKKNRTLMIWRKKSGLEMVAMLVKVAWWPSKMRKKEEGGRGGFDGRIDRARRGLRRRDLEGDKLDCPQINLDFHRCN